MKKGNVNIVRDHRENQKNKKISIRPNNWGVCFCADKHCAELPPDERERDSNRRIFIILCEIWQNLCCCLSVCWPNSHITNQLAILTNKSRELILLYLNYLSNDRSEFIRWLFFSLQIGSSAINIIIKSVKNSPRAMNKFFSLISQRPDAFVCIKLENYILQEWPLLLLLLYIIQSSIDDKTWDSSWADFVFATSRLCTKSIAYIYNLFTIKSGENIYT